MMTSLIQNLLSNSALKSPDGVGGAADGGSTAPAGGGTSSPPATADSPPSGAVGAHDSTSVDEEEDLSGSGDFFLGADDDGEAVAKEPTADSQTPQASESVKESATPGVQQQQAKPGATKEPPASLPASPPVPTAHTAEPVAVAPQQEPAAVGKESAKEPEKTLVQRIEEGRENVLKTLSQTRFKLTDEETAEFEAGDAQFIPKYGARVFFETFRSCAELIEQAVPGMVANAIAASKVQQSADDEFYGSRQDLLPHREKIHATAKALRQVNPDMPKEQFVTLLETTARAMLGVPAQAPAPNSTPAAAPKRRNGAAPHSPVVSSVPVGVKATGVVDGGDWGFLSDRLGES